MTREDNIDVLNIVLIAISLLACWFTPVQLFLFSYAVLGPLHYLTEISWLHDRSYFTSNKSAVRLLLCLGVASLLIPLTIYLAHITFTQLYLWYQLSALIIFAAVAVSAIAVFNYQMLSLKKSAMLAGLAVMVLLFPQFTTFFASYVTTLVHVFVFTWLFMLAGALKSKRMTSFVALGFFTICAVAALCPWSSAVNLYVPRDLLLNLQAFGRLDIKTAQMLGWQQPVQIFAVMRFIAFAYTYHYLNWFSKTQLIGWHRISKSRLAFIAALYIAAVGLYAIDYTVGLKAALFLSLVHVYLEFPLNFRTMASLGSELRKAWERHQTLIVPVFIFHTPPAHKQAAASVMHEEARV